MAYLEPDHGVPEGPGPRIPEPMRTLEIPADPPRREFLAGRHSSVMTHLRDLDRWFREEIHRDVDAWALQRGERERILPGTGRQLRLDEAWAREHPEQAAEILEQLVRYLDDLCHALRLQEADGHQTPADPTSGEFHFPDRSRETDELDT